MEKISSKLRRKQTATATAEVMEGRLVPVGEHKESELRGGVVVTAQSLAMAARESAEEVNRQVARIELIVLMLSQDRKAVDEATRGPAEKDGKQFALPVPVMVKGKQAYGDDGKPLYKETPQAPMIYWLVKPKNGAGISLNAARTRAGEIRAMRDAIYKGGFDWTKYKRGGWKAVIDAARSYKAERSEADKVAERRSKVDALYTKKREEAGIPLYEADGITAHMVSEAERAKLLKLRAEAEEETPVGVDQESPDQRAKRIAARIIKDRGWDVAQAVAKIIEATPKPNEAEADKDGTLATAMKATGTGSKKRTKRDAATTKH